MAKDAQAEADAFLAVAAPKSGDLLPVLDLETDGLSPALMVQWTAAWLGRVHAQSGAKAILYTYPAFWSKTISKWSPSGSYQMFKLSPAIPALPSSAGPSRMP